MTDLETLAGTFGFTEGPRWHDGALWFSDFSSRQVLSVTEGGQVTRRAYVVGQPSGLGFAPDGSVLAVSSLDRRVVRFDPEPSDHPPVLVASTIHTYAGALNDMVVDQAGRAYISPFNDTAVHDARAVGGPAPGTPLLFLDEGKVTLATEGMESPNGLVLTPDGSTLIVAETSGRRLTAFDVGADGHLCGRRVFADLDGRAPDGLCLDRSGALWVGCPFAEEFVRVGEGGRILESIRTPGRWAVAPALGGEDGRTLFCCTAETTLEMYFAGRSTARIEFARVTVPAPT